MLINIKYAMARFILETDNPSGRTWARIFLLRLIIRPCINTGNRRIIRQDELSALFVFADELRWIIRLCV